jgi:aspartate aminotransferase
MTSSLRQSPTLAINESIRRAQGEGQDILHLAFGEAGLPVHPLFAEHLEAGTSSNVYGPVAGDQEVRSAAAAYLSRRGVSAGPDDIVMTPGSKAALFALVSVLPGDVVLPSPAWVSYAAQAALAGKRVIFVPIPAEAGGVPDPDRLPDVLGAARRTGARPGILLVTIPDNPTGTVAGEKLVTRVCEVAAAEGLVVVSDEIYRDLAYAPGGVVSPAQLMPDATYVTSGLSKAWALGGWRIGFLRSPATDSGRSVLRSAIGFASEIWSCLPGPMNAIARLALSEPAELTTFVADARVLHQQVSLAVHDRFMQVGGVASRTPEAAFYQYPDFGSHREELAAAGVSTSDDLAHLMLSRFGIGVLPGTAFGADPRYLQVRVSTSLLYGQTSQERWETLEASRRREVLQLPRIATALDRISSCLEALASGR